MVRRALVGAGLTLGAIVVGGALMSGTAAANELPDANDCVVTAYDQPTVVPGQPVTINFTVSDTTPEEGCEPVELSFASYRTPSSGPFNPGTIEQQVLTDSDTGFFSPGDYSMTVDVPAATSTSEGTAHPDCSVQHDNSQGRGANQSPGPYDNTCDGSASQNGRGGGNANGRPCAGCVGNADDKNPPGQYPNGSDHNAGYECDRNQGVGQTNPAHTGCSGTTTGFQVDFAYGPVIPQLSLSNMYGDGKIWSANG